VRRWHCSGSACPTRPGSAPERFRAGRHSAWRSRAYCQQASVILADEPVSALDPRAAEEVMALLADLAHSDGLAVLSVLHQPELALRHADRVVGMKLGQVQFSRPPGELSPEEIGGLDAHLHEA